MKFKKSQISLFLIIGILVLFLLGLLYFKSNFVNKDISLKKEQNINFDTNMEKCINFLVFEAVDEYGLCNTENFIEEHIMNNLYSCLNTEQFLNKGYILDLESHPKSVNVEIFNETILIYIYYPIRIAKDEFYYNFEKGDFRVSRLKQIDIVLDNNKVKNNYFLVSPDNKLDIFIPKNTKINNYNQNNLKLSLYIKELCPDNPYLLGRIKYEISPELNFDNNVFISIRYNDNFNRKNIEKKFKVSYLDNNIWKQISSDSNVEKDYVRAATNHLSEWSANCEGANKLGNTLMFNELILSDTDLSKDVVKRDLNCAYNFSGQCGYVKVIFYLRPDNQDYIKVYKDIIYKIYDKQLIPIITLKEKPSDSFYIHPGDCQTILNCKYGENEDGTEKPIYDYSQSADLAKRLIDELHKDKRELPLYVEIGEEPNLAYEWGDISITDYQIKQYAKYFSEIASAIKSLDHSNNIKIMSAGLAPTYGLKKCELTPSYAKQFDTQPDSFELPKEGSYSFKKGDCKLLGFDYNYIINNNYCTPESIANINFNLPSCASKDICCNEISNPNCEPKTDCYDSEKEKAEQCVCPVKRNYIKEISEWYNFYVSKGYNHVFADLKNEVESALNWDCNENNYESNQQVQVMEKVKQRILDTFGKYCYEKIVEVNTNEYLNKFLSDQDYGVNVCRLIDVYADHTYPDENSLDSEDGGQNPFGINAYKERFSILNNICNNKLKVSCTLPYNVDADSDGIFDIFDNCPLIKNEDQKDRDKDGIGDVCDDSDKDGKVDSEDKCPNLFDISDGEDTDNDGIADVCDNCVNFENNVQQDLDMDGVGDACDSDIDGDGIPEIGFDSFCKDSITNCKDNCKYVPNGKIMGTCLNKPNIICNANTDCSDGVCEINQKDSDGDGVGDVCDNCPDIKNPDQADWNNNGKGDACEDTDGDGFIDKEDKCPAIYSTENKDDFCKSEELCIGKIIITETTWMPHPRIHHKQEFSDLDIDNYASKMKAVFKLWEEDDNVLSVIHYHLGEEDTIVQEKLRNYSYTKQMCENNCVGKNIFNVLAENLNPIDKCEEELVINGPCTTSKVFIKNLKSEVGEGNIVYKCYDCQNEYKEPSNNPEKTFNVNGINYLYYDMSKCFEKQISLPNYCPDSDGSVREGILCEEFEIDNIKYYGLIKCEPSITSNNAIVHICGTVEECKYNKNNCCESGGNYGNRWHSCKKLN
ncbi:MAG: thrombospondin type 3 repeat-containing protein [Candidatus Woesearchaeota archaeon]